MSPSKDPAEAIQKSMERMVLPRWGHAIYRTTYGDDAKFAKFMEKMTESMRSGVEFYGQGQMMETLHWHVVEDPALDGANKATVREKFDEWVRSGADQPPRENATHHFTLDGTAALPRYRYCIQVDEAVLKAVVDGEYDRQPDDPWGDGYVNYIRRNWQEDPEYKKMLPPQNTYPEDEEEEDEEDFDEQWPPIEGDTNFDVGWMKVLPKSVAPYLYSCLVDTQYWDAWYERPPKYPRM